MILKFIKGCLQSEKRGLKMDTWTVSVLTDEKKESFYKFTAEYLPDAGRDRLEEFFKAYREAFLILEINGEMAGTVFGRDRSVQFPDDRSFELCGIAVRHDHQRKGYGRNLLAEFEKAARRYGAEQISLGSAGGYVEEFYINCGYVPSEYKEWENGTPCLKKMFSDIDDYKSYIRSENDGFVVMRKNL